MKLTLPENRAIAHRHLPYVGESGIIFASKTLEQFPFIKILDAIRRVYPFEYAVTNLEAKYHISFQLTLFLTHYRTLVGEIVAKISEQDQAENRQPYALSRSGRPEGASDKVVLHFSHSNGNEVVSIVGGGKGKLLSRELFFTLFFIGKVFFPEHSMPRQHEVLTAMLQSHVIGRDICIIGSMLTFCE